MDSVIIEFKESILRVEGCYTPEDNGGRDYPSSEAYFEIENIFIVDGDNEIETGLLLEDYFEDIENIVLKQGEKSRDSEAAEYKAEAKGWI